MENIDLVADLTPEMLEALLARFAFLVIGAVVAWRLMRRAFGKVAHQDLDHLRRLGFSQVPGSGEGGSRYVGTFRGLRAGYNLGESAESAGRTSMRSRASLPHLGLSFASGSELWVELPDGAPALAVVERKDLPVVAPDLPRAPEMGHRKFDRRFAVSAHSPALARAVLTPAMQQRLLAQPHVSLVADQGAVRFVITARGAAKLNKAHRLPGRRNGFRHHSALLALAETFLDEAVAMRQALVSAAAQPSRDPATGATPVRRLGALPHVG